MTFRATSQLLINSLTRAKSLALSLKGTCDQYATLMTGGATADDIFQLHATMTGMIANFNTIAAVPNLATYAQAQEGDDTYNIATEFTAMVTALTTVRNWIEANFPKDGNGNLLSHTFVNHVRTPVSFTAQQLLTLRSNVLALSDTIS